MKTLYIFDDYQLSSTCGVGTYLGELLKCISRWNDMHVCMIMFNTRAEECCLYTHEGTDYMLFPHTLDIKPFERTVYLKIFVCLNYFLFICLYY